jgi:hypothetical protein
MMPSIYLKGEERRAHMPCFPAQPKMDVYSWGVMVGVKSIRAQSRVHESKS